MLKLKEKVFQAQKSPVSVPVAVAGSPVQCGFPSPADDYLVEKLDLNDFLVPRPYNTFMIRAKGNSMQVKIFDGDLLVVDKSIRPRSGHVVVAVVEGEFTVKRFIKNDDGVFLVPDNPKFNTIEVTDNDSRIWGVITSVIHKL